MSLNMRFGRSLICALLCTLPVSAAGWKLVWADEFDRPGAPDPARWTYEEGFIRNRESQYYTKARMENARVENGVLVIEARRERLKNAAYQPGSNNPRRQPEFAEYTSASLTTEGKAAWRHARVEVRAKLPTGRGAWPAIWMLGVNRREAGWPRCGEIDIMENVGFEPDVIHANVHTAKYNHVKRTGKGSKITVPRPHSDFHIYAVEWDAARMAFSVDGRKYFTYENEKSGEDAWPFDQPFYLILNTAIGGAWGGRHGIDDSIFPQRYEVDYVRVYEKR
jgi:beta-glucanase (GH16 family)